MPQTLKIQSFLERTEDTVLIDVRSESEFDHAHIPGAQNVPLLNNENRRIIGTIYKQEGREAAIAKGFELVGPLFGDLYAKLTTAVNGKTPVFYCWRGGMRSNIAASVLEWGGQRTLVISGGYKAYRNAVLKGLERELKTTIISGFTGVGKTEILHLLEKKGAQIVDLEGIARHKGSALGGLGMPTQFSNEMFENILFDKWRSLDSEKYVFIENESRKIGGNVIPESVWEQMEKAKMLDIIVPREIRMQRILKEYGDFSVDLLSGCTEKIKKRLGGLNLKNALEALRNDDIAGWADILMDYYDRTYMHSRKDKEVRAEEFVWDWNESELSAEKFLKRFQ
jgi:tRNA 2-selenouridine synthase